MYQKVTLIGRIGKEPEIKQVGENRLAKITLATSESYKDKTGTRQETTEWHNVTIWGKLAEVVEKHVKKGDLILIEGRLHYDSYEKDGIKHYTTEIRCDNLKMLGSKSDSKPQPSAGMNDVVEAQMEDLPF